MIFTFKLFYNSVENCHFKSRILWKFKEKTQKTIRTMQQIIIHIVPLL